nr:NAD(P)-binding domain-containing protein [uncultured Azohydromonas sp.]
MALALREATPAQPPRNLPVAVIGAGPVGLAAAARLIERGIEPLVLEAGAQVGAHLLDYGHVRLFSPWRYDIDPAMAAQLASTGWNAPPDDEVPLAREVVERVLQPYAALPAVARTVHLNTRVTAISREGFDKVKSAGREAAPFLIRAQRDRRSVEFRARAVIDASGTWSQPNPLGASGLPALGERELADAVFYGLPDVLGRNRARYAGRRTLVVGAGHSAANALLALAELAEAEPATHFVWAVRSPNLARVFGGGSADALPARGALGSALRGLRDSGRMEFVSGLRIAALRREPDGLVVEGTGADGQRLVLEGIDQIVCATGQRPDLALVSELRLKLDPWLESTEALGPLIDPNLHSCGTVRPHGHRELAHPEPGFYTLGVKSYGRAPTFLMATGFEQARSVVAAIAGDLEAADRVELDLPETGICSAGPDFADTGTGGDCCGGPAQPKSTESVESTVCCGLDVQKKKAEGEAGCGCGEPAPTATAPVQPASCCGTPVMAEIKVAAHCRG